MDQKERNPGFLGVEDYIVGKDGVRTGHLIASKRLGPNTFPTRLVHPPEEENDKGDYFLFDFFDAGRVDGSGRYVTPVELQRVACLACEYRAFNVFEHEKPLKQAYEGFGAISIMIAVMIVLGGVSLWLINTFFYELSGPLEGWQDYVAMALMFVFLLILVSVSSKLSVPIADYFLYAPRERKAWQRHQEFLAEEDSLVRRSKRNNRIREAALTAIDRALDDLPPEQPPNAKQNKAHFAHQNRFRARLRRMFGLRYRKIGVLFGVPVRAVFHPQHSNDRTYRKPFDEELLGYLWLPALVLVLPLIASDDGDEFFGWLFGGTPTALVVAAAGALMIGYFVLCMRVRSRILKWRAAKKERFEQLLKDELTRLRAAKTPASFSTVQAIEDYLDRYAYH